MTATDFLRALLLHGAIFSICSYWRYFQLLNESIEAHPEDRILHERYYANLRRCEERILYGTALTRKQREYIKLIKGRGITTAEIRALFLGKSINSDGERKYIAILELPLAALGWSTIVLSLTWIVGLGFELLTLNSSAGSKIAVFATVSGLFILPLYALSTYSTAPLRVNLKLNRLQLPSI